MTAGERRGFRWPFVLLAIGWAWMIFAFSAQPSDRPPPPFWIALLWNGGHAAVYGLLSFLLLSGLPDKRTWWIGGVLACAVYGALDEWHQASVPGRVPSVHDAVTDVCGACFGWTVVRLTQRPTRARFGWFLAVGALCFVAALLATL